MPSQLSAAAPFASPPGNPQIGSPDPPPGSAPVGYSPLVFQAAPPGDDAGAALFRTFPFEDAGVLWDSTLEPGAVMPPPSGGDEEHGEFEEGDEHGEQFGHEASPHGSLSRKEREKGEGVVRRRSSVKKERTHVCPQCGKGFLTAGHVSRHAYSHLKEEDRPHGGSPLLPDAGTAR
ncbi:hypothetical protein DFJ74DRAFT_664005 [Hyaloraphidium curvatum]|nr:hypothetical protein DFJ74DRAFT_664005 [Hyaloraphidium curvatum]